MDYSPNRSTSSTVLVLTVFVLNIMIIRLYILLVSYMYFLLTWLSGYFGRKVINKLDLT